MVGTHAQLKGVGVSVTPASCLHDEAVSVVAAGLTAGQAVTLASALTDTRNVTYLATAHYRADSDGVVDVGVASSEGGSYKGVFPMGLVGALLPAPGEYQYTRFFKRDVENPSELRLSVHDGHLSREEVCEDAAPLAKATHVRHYMAPGVTRVPVRYKRVRGCLYLPPGPGPFPGVVDMFGTAGGLLEYRSAQLASRGVAALALAFFAYDDLPKNLEEFDIGYFEEAVEFLLNHEKVQKPHVGAMGVSKGGDLALSMATFIPEVRAAVWINGCNANVQSTLRLRDGIIPGLEFSLDRVKIEDGVMDCYDVVMDPSDHPDTVIPVEQADANFLFLVGQADRNWKSEYYANLAVQRLQKAGKSNYELVKYKGTGHLIEPPHSPFCYSSFHKVVGGPMVWGGESVSHLRAQEHGWAAAIDFLHKHLATRAKL